MRKTIPSTGSPLKKVLCSATFEEFGPTHDFFDYTGCRSAGALLAEEGPGKVPEPAVLAKPNSSPDTSVTVGSAATVGLRSARDSLRADLARHASHSDQKT